MRKQYKVVGVMSGTSLDGVDLAWLEFSFENKWSFEILKSETIAYSQQWIDRLKSGVDLSATELVVLNKDYTQLLAEIIRSFVKKNDIQKLDAVCSHGHTILHQPQNGFTLQIGNLPEIASLTGQKVVCDFRVQDVQLGGQGAPLVPIGDKILFSNYDFCINLGGFSNVSFEEKNQRIAFDISPVNTVLNFYANALNLAFDNKGEMARTGILNSDLLAKLDDLDFYKQNYPKSLGFEFVKNTILPLIEKYEIKIEDKLRTFTEHIAKQTFLALQPFVNQNKTQKILITGGGAYNDFLIERIRFYLPKTTISIPDNQILEFKEALIFGLLGVLKLENEINVLSSVTGAQTDHSSGVVFE